MDTGLLQKRSPKRLNYRCNRLCGGPRVGGGSNEPTRRNHERDPSEAIGSLSGQTRSTHPGCYAAEEAHRWAGQIVTIAVTLGGPSRGAPC
jgi:hypothetical protein